VTSPKENSVKSTETRGHNGKHTTTKLKNRIRGAYALLNSKVPPSIAGEALVQQRRATSAISEALAEARSKLAGSEREEFEVWAAEVSRSYSKKIKLGRNESLLGLVPSVVGDSNLLKLLHFNRDQLASIANELSSFVETLLSINSLISSGNYEAAVKAIDSIAANHGLSYWSIEAKIALLHADSDQSAAKSFIGRLSINAPGLNAFYLYHFGLRNEVSQSTARFTSLINRRLKDSDISVAYKSYAAYRVARQIPSDKKTLGHILSYEQYSSKIDLFFTTTRVSIAILADPSAFSTEELEMAKEILSLTNGYSEIFNGESLVLSQKLSSCIHNSVSIALNRRSKEILQEAASIAEGLAAMLSYSGSEANEEKLRKEVLNFWWLPQSVIFDSAGTIPRLADVYAENWIPARNPIHPLIAKCLDSFDEQISNLKDVEINSPLRDLPNEFPWSLGDFSPAELDCLSAKACWDSYRDDDYRLTLRLVQFALLKNQRLLPAVPLQKMFGGVKYERIKTYGISIDLCNCLHWYTQLDNERQNRTFKRFAIEEWVDKISSDGVAAAASTLLQSTLNADIREFFLTAACDISTIELFFEIEGSRQALTVRAQLLILAATISTHSSALILEEVDAITEQLKVDEVLEQLDETMVNVDEEALLPVIGRELSGDFERYKFLLKGEENTRSSVNELLQNLRQQSATAFKIPESEAANVLLQMIQACLDRFIDDPVYGLDAIVGRRIRHGTISGELRGMLEQHHLIGQRPRSGADYQLPQSVNQLIKPYDPQVRRAVIRAFSRFSTAIDALAARLRDEAFQCKERVETKTKNKIKNTLEPAFEISPGAVMFAFASDIANRSETADVFASELFSTFWLILSFSVERSRPVVKEFTERALADASSRLVQDLKASNLEEASFLASILRASEELQRKAELICSWIRIPTVSIENREYPMQLIFDAAIAYVKAKVAGFEPVSVENINDNILLDAHAFPIATDALRIAVGNIAEHSGIRKGNRIFTKIEVNSMTKHLCFTFISDIAKNTWTRERASKLEAIRADILKRSFADRAKSAKGSGIAKLATIVQRSPICALEFGPLENEQRFKLYFELDIRTIEACPE